MWGDGLGGGDAGVSGRAVGSPGSRVVVVGVETFHGHDVCVCVGGVSGSADIMAGLFICRIK